MATAAIMTLVSCLFPAESFAQTLGQSLREEQAREMANEQAAEYRASLPHPVSAAYKNPLSPVVGLAEALPNKTLHLQTAIVQNGNYIRTEVASIYLSADGYAYSANWAHRLWSVRGSALCITANQEPACMTAYSDAKGQGFLLGPTNLLVQLGSMTVGDRDDMKGAYERAQQEEAEQSKVGNALAMIAIPLLIAGIMGDDNGNENSSSNSSGPPGLVTFEVQQREQQARDQQYQADHPQQ